MSARPSKFHITGLKLAVCAHSYMSEKFKLPADVDRATTPINSSKSPTRLVKKASRAAVTTKG
ncbi:hypothetical protein RINTHM_4400 [Richelia intracellularis HM01]|nr:hypothetical protein RINTHM_4400 [Richelia intracellularis HM01]